MRKTLTWEKDVRPNWPDRPSWLPLNSEHRINHSNCPSGEDTKERLYVKVVPRGHIFHCFNCGGSGVLFPKEKKFLRTDELYDYLDEDKVKVRPIPPGTQFSDPNVIPVDYAAWLYKYYITDEDIRSGDLIGWSNSKQRLFIHSGSNVWAARSLYTEPKYDNYVISNNHGYLAWGGQCATEDYNDIAFVVEDGLSAYRLGKVTNHWSAATMGTTLTDQYVSKLISETLGRTKVLIWFDPDQAGAKGEREGLGRLLAFRKTYTSFELQCAGVGFPNKQPKECTDDEIRAAVKAFKVYTT